MWNYYIPYLYLKKRSINTDLVLRINAFKKIFLIYSEFLKVFLNIFFLILYSFKYV